MIYNYIYKLYIIIYIRLKSNILQNKNLKSSVGTIGHVAHGKSTIVKAISGVQTVRFKNELERNITIKLGK